MARYKAGAGWEPIGTINSTITHSYWDTQASGLPTSTWGEGKTTAEMKRQATFSAVGWGFGGTWAIAEGVTYPYP